MQNVLVVDDEESVRLLLRDCLELDGYEVREAADALQAIDRIGEGLPDCMILDVMMPGMSGLELVEKLRSDPLTALVPVLMLTAATDDETTWTGWANGVNYFVPKPFDIDHLLDWVGRLCAPESDVPEDPGVFDIDIDIGAPASSRPVSVATASEDKPAAHQAPTLQGQWGAGHEGPQVEELLRALDTGQLWVAYQPVVALDTLRVVGVEALVRWAHPHRGDLAPSEFLSLAERHGLVSRVDDVVLRDAVHQVGVWNSQRSGAGVKPLVLAINVSPDRLMHESFCSDLRTILRTNGLAPAIVSLELSEVALMRLLDGSPTVVQELRELGVRLAFDDFSAAATSLSFLQRFDVDVVKIDRSLVRSLGLEDAGDDSEAATLISLAHRLGRSTVAEGVETTEQAEHLSRLGCEYAQGYLFGAPASAAQLGRRLLAG